MVLQILLSNSTFKECSAGVNGGGLYLPGSTKVEIEESMFESNEAAQNGAAVSVSGEPVVTVRRCSFTNNHAKAAVSTPE